MRGVKKAIVVVCLCGAAHLGANDEYILGQGLKLGAAPINIGGYLTGYYSVGQDKKSVVSIDDVAVMAYGEITPKLSAMAEFESAGFFEKSFYMGRADERYRGTLRVERAYLNYSFGDDLSVKIGKFVTPAGIWNQTPLPVFKETFSKPRLSTEIFPRFSTGVTLYGATPSQIFNLEYNFFTQVGKDLDPIYNNIETKEGLGGSLSAVADAWFGGVAFGKYKNVKTQEDSRYFGIYQSYSLRRFKITAEAFASFNEGDAKERKNGFYKKESYYVQGVYKILPQLSGVWRNEYFKDGFSADTSTINTLGLNYKPHPAISFKLEKQFGSKKDGNTATASFSFLF